MTPQPVGSEVALITGPSKGIGLEMGRQLSRQGMTILVGARHEERGEKAAEGLRSAVIGACSVEHLRQQS